MQILNRIKKFFRGEAKSEIVPLDVTMPYKGTLLMGTHQEAETKYQNLMDGAWVEPKTDSSNFMAHTRYVWPIEKEYMGYMVLAEDEKDEIEKMGLILWGKTEGFMTIAEFQKKFTNLYKEDVDVFHDDVYLVKDVIKPTNYNVDKTYRLYG